MNHELEDDENNSLSYTITSIGFHELKVSERVRERFWVIQNNMFDHPSLANALKHKLSNLRKANYDICNYHRLLEVCPSCAYCFSRIGLLWGCCRCRVADNDKA